MISRRRFERVWPGQASRLAAVILVLGMSTALGVPAMVAEDPDITIVPRSLIEDAATKIVTILGRKGQ